MSIWLLQSTIKIWVLNDDNNKRKGEKDLKKKHISNDEQIFSVSRSTHPFNMRDGWRCDETMNLLHFDFNWMPSFIQYSSSYFAWNGKNFISNIHLKAAFVWIKIIQFFLCERDTTLSWKRFERIIFKLNSIRVRKCEFNEKKKIFIFFFKNLALIVVCRT